MADNQYEHVTHGFDPVYDRDSRILILGTLPSVKSREQHFYYGHPQNRFWRVMAALTNAQIPVTISEKKLLLLSHGIALWDVIQSCDIIGSSDSSIRNVVSADIRPLLKESRISAVFGNGAKACELYQKYTLPTAGVPIRKLPSTSPANASWTLERLIACWGEVLKQYLH